MNDQLQKFARNSLKDSLAKLPENNQILFRRMYSHKNVNAKINDIIDAMPVDKLDWAMQQAQRSMAKLRA